MKATLHITLAVTTFVLSHIVIAQTNNSPTESSTATNSELSPGTTLFVIKRFSLTTSDGGLQGVSVGKKVTLIREDMGDYIISDGINEGRAPKSSFSNDQKAAEQVRLNAAEKDQIIAEQKNAYPFYIAVIQEYWFPGTGKSDKPGAIEQVIGENTSSYILRSPKGVSLKIPKDITRVVSSDEAAADLATKLSEYRFSAKDTDEFLKVSSQQAEQWKQNAEQWKQNSAYWENVAKERLKLVEMAIAIIDKQERQNSTRGMAEITEINRQLMIIRNQQLMH